MYRFRALGGAALLRDGSPLDSIGAQRKLIALLALLALARRRGISRDRIASYLWPESDMERARGALKQSLYLVRRQLGSADVVVGTAELRLNPELIETDVEEFLTASEDADHARVVELYGGPFLDGFHLSGAAEFEQWVDEQRAVLAHHYAHSLEELAGDAQQRGRFAEAAAAWRRLQAQDPFNARAMIGLMEALDAGGQRAAALEAGRTYVTLMREEVGTDADPAVSELMLRLRTGPRSDAVREAAVAEPADPTTPTASRGRPGAEQAEVTTAAPPREPQRSRAATATRRRARAIGGLVLIAILGAIVWQIAFPSGSPGRSPPAGSSIAVLPFVNVGDDEADEPFADGLTDELISRLGKVAGMRVSARTSTFALKGKGLSARAIADTLGVATLLEGTVRRSADRLKITAQLVDARDNSVLWSESFDRRMQDVFAVQEEIALAIARALQTQLPARSPGAATARPTANLEAYDLYLRGRYEWQLPPRQRLEQAAQYHQRAVERDPAFASAYAALAETYVNLAVYGYMPPGEALARARVASEQALALAPDLVEALGAHSYVLMSELDFSAAEADLRRAIAINPSYPWAHHFYSLLLMMVGRPAEAVAYNRQALTLDPLSLPANATRGILQAQLGEYAVATRELARARELAPDFTLTAYYQGVVLAAQGSYEPALRSLETASRQAPDYPGLPGALAFVQERLGRGAVADSIRASLERRSGDVRAHTNLAFGHAVAGRYDVAFETMHRIKWDVPALIGLRADPLLAPLRSDPRFDRLVRRIGAQR